MSDIQKKLVEIVKLKENPSFQFEQILNYINLVKKYDTTHSKTYRCEWLSPLVLKTLITNHIAKNDLPPGTTVGNISTFNYIKVPKII